MDQSLECWFICHPLSKNLGDRHQITCICDYILQTGSLFLPRVVNVAYGGTENDSGTRVETEHGVGPLILLPEEVDVRTCGMAVLLTGSFFYDCLYAVWIDQLLTSPACKKIIIWGGLTRGWDELPVFIERMYPLLGADKRVIFWARSQEDGELFKAITGRTDWIGAGDPIASVNVAGKPADRKARESSIIFISSVYLEERCPEITAVIKQRANWIIYIDPDADQECVFAHTNEKNTLAINDPRKLIRLFERARPTCVISGRLHGGLLAAMSGIPTALIANDTQQADKGSYKFSAMAAGFDSLPICEVFFRDEIEKTVSFMEKTPDLHDRWLGVENYRRRTECSLMRLFINSA